MENLAPYDSVFNLPQGDQQRDFAHTGVNELISIVGGCSVPVLWLVLSLCHLPGQLLEPFKATV
ncbi:MAG: hypothetical protein JKY66_08455 [Spongiibacteraceae bacterium]|nr:hypothetical protein [Spongiibacteraceae bacterium]